MNIPSIYLHIPYCKKKCTYCSFLSFSKTRVQDYLLGIKEEMTLLRKKFSLRPQTIFWGGGTPSILTVGEFKKLFSFFHEFCDLTRLSEWTVECNPDSITPEKLALFKESGVTRISFGVQAMDNKSLGFLSRPHNQSDVRKVLIETFDAGFSNVNVDLIMGIPYQKAETYFQNLEEILKFPVTHISAYMLQIEENTPMGRWAEKEHFQQDGEKFAGMFLRMDKTLKLKNWNHYEISNYCLPGYECAHNMKCWNYEEYIGLGPGAWSFYGKMRKQNPVSLDSYLDSLLHKHQLPLPEEIDEISEKYQEFEKIMLGLRTFLGISKKELKEYVGDTGCAFLEKLLAENILCEKGECYCFTPDGWLISNEVFLRWMPV